MTSFIGLPGALAAIACPVSEVTSSGRSVSELVPFSGDRVVQLGRRVRRSWSIDYGAEHPRDYAVLDAVSRWESPLVWVGALAQATNLLTPEQATLQAAKYGGSRHLNLAQNPRYEHGLTKNLIPGTQTTGGGGVVEVIDGWAALTPSPGQGEPILYGIDTRYATPEAFQGKTFTVSATLRLDEEQAGDLSPIARQLVFGYVDAAGVYQYTAAESEKAPNAPGEYRLAVTCHVPADMKAWFVRFVGGSGVTPTYWTKVQVEEGATSGLWFDGSTAGARTGLMNVDGMPVVTWAGGPIGGQINVTGDQPVPVIPGTPVTVSIWGKRAGPRTSARLSYWFRDATGAQVEAATLSGSSSDDLVRRSWTLTPPPGAATLSVLIRDAAILALPQVTWTPDAVDWSPGRGVHRVVVLPGSESPLVAHSRQVLTSAAYTILEVG